MSKSEPNIHLTITRDYAPTWKTWEGVREFVQNWYDGVLDSYEEVSPPLYGKRRCLKIEPKNEDCSLYEANLVHEHQSTLLGTVAYERESKRLTMVNHNTELHNKVLLLGYTKKRTHHDIIGQFGEGLKIGTLALLRASHKVVVATKNKIWNFKIEEHPQFKENVLTVSIEDNNAAVPQNIDTNLRIGDGDTVSQIWPIEEDKWNEWVKRFLFLVPAKDSVETEIGSLLFDDQLLQQLYVKQIWVEDRREKNDLHVGVNFKDVQIDRDRRAILYQSEIDHSVGIMWSRALKHKPELAERYYHLLEKSDHISDVRLANMYLEDRGVVRLLAEEFFKLYGSNAIPVPNSTAAERLSYLHKELQEKVVLCNQNLIDILKKSGKVRMVEDVLNQQQPEKSAGRKLFKDIPDEQLHVLAEAEQFVKMVYPNFNTSNIDFHDGRESIVTRYSDNNFEVPQWMLCPEYIHQFIACPAENAEACYCAPSFVCERILSSMGNRSNDAGDRKIQEFVMTLALLAKGKRPKQRPGLSSIEDVLRRNEEELLKKIEYLTTCLRDQQKRHEVSLEEMRQDLAQFQSVLANEDVRFVERENDLIEKQKQERDEMTRAYQEQLKLHEQAMKNLEADYFHANDELHVEKKKKMDIESEVERQDERHKNELQLKNQETLAHRKRLATCSDQFTRLQSLAKKSGLSKKSELGVELQRLIEQTEEEYRSDKCMICTTAKKTVVLTPCNHQCCSMCNDAGLKICPVCQKIIDGRK